MNREEKVPRGKKRYLERLAEDAEAEEQIKEFDINDDEEEREDDDFTGISSGLL